jgi:regulator of sigma D
MAQTFIVDCSFCKAKVAAEEAGRAERSYFDEYAGEPFAERLVVGKCPSCGSLLAGYSRQTHFENIDSEIDVWSDAVRIYPKPAKTFSSLRIPASATNSLTQADQSLQANAPDAACVMFGRALEVVCRDLLLTVEEKRAVQDGTSRKHILLAEGIKQLRAKNIIDDRLFDWSHQLRAFRNVAAHAINDEAIPREDAEDLQAFVYAIIEYIYDLTDRYEEFKERQENKKKPKPRPKGAFGQPRR